MKRKRTRVSLAWPQEENDCSAHPHPSVRQEGVTGRTSKDVHPVHPDRRRLLCRRRLLEVTLAQRDLVATRLRLCHLWRLRPLHLLAARRAR